jgi:dipeptidase E
MPRNSVELHLFSTPGRDESLDWVVEACRPYLDDKPHAILAYLPLASLYAEKLLAETEKAFNGLGRLETINTETMEMAEMEAVMRRASMVYIPGGNTFLLNHRLHISRLFPYLRQKIQAGLPLVGVSAGTVLCGPNILTSNDLNMVPTPHFEGLNLTPFNFNVHYTDDEQGDNRLLDYQAFHDNPVLLMEDGAYIRVRGKDATLVRGRAWIWRAGQEKERLQTGGEIPVHAEVKNG